MNLGKIIDLEPGKMSGGLKQALILGLLAFIFIGSGGFNTFMSGNFSPGYGRNEPPDNNGPMGGGFPPPDNAQGMNRFTSPQSSNHSHPESNAKGQNTKGFQPLGNNLGMNGFGPPPGDFAAGRFTPPISGFGVNGFPMPGDPMTNNNHTQGGTPQEKKRHKHHHYKENEYGETINTQHITAVENPQEDMKNPNSPEATYTIE